MKYYLWNKLICKRFFNSENKGKRVYLSITEAEIEEISQENPGLNLGGYDGFINSIIKGPLALHEDYWQGILKKALLLFRLYKTSVKLGNDDEWKSLTKDRLEYPPFVGYLSFFVLAEFENIGTQSSIAYYDKVDQLLSKYLSPDEVRNNFTNRSLQPIDNLWDALALWSTETKNGDYGEFVTHKRSSFRYVFRAKEQALLNYPDRKKLFIVLSKRFTAYFLPNMKQVGLAILENTSGRYNYLFAPDQLTETTPENRLLQKTIYSIIIHDLKSGLILSKNETIHKTLHLIPFIHFKDLMGGRISYRINLHKTNLKEFCIELRGKSFQIIPSPDNSDWSQPIRNEEDLCLTGFEWSNGADFKVSLDEYILISNKRDIRIFSKTIDSRKIPGEPYVEVNRLKPGGTYIIATNNNHKYRTMMGVLASSDICDNYESESITTNKPDEWEFIRLEGLRNNIPQLPELYIEPADDYTPDELDLTIDFSGGIHIKTNEYLNIALPSIQITDFSPGVIDSGGKLFVTVVAGKQEYELIHNSDHPILSVSGPYFYDDYAELNIGGIPDEGTRFIIEVKIPAADEIVSVRKEFKIHVWRFEIRDIIEGITRSGKMAPEGLLKGFDINGFLSKENQKIFSQGFVKRSNKTRNEKLSLDLSLKDIEDVFDSVELSPDVEGYDIEQKIRDLRNKAEFLKLRLRDENL